MENGDGVGGDVGCCTASTLFDFLIRRASANKIHFSPQQCVNMSVASSPDSIYMISNSNVSHLLLLRHELSVDTNLEEGTLDIISAYTQTPLQDPPSTQHANPLCPFFAKGTVIFPRKLEEVYAKHVGPAREISVSAQLLLFAFAPAWLEGLPAQESDIFQRLGIITKCCWSRDCHIDLQFAFKNSQPRSFHDFDECCIDQVMVGRQTNDCVRHTGFARIHVDVTFG
mmetsp:Transcript_11397/g.28332  ORF Transcript_11397/g.28332 Transcript_11397/m.28332 type:complete len:227 (-) Transcript_11397:1855-2535(-)